jgi:hypothetical protein
MEERRRGPRRLLIHVAHTWMPLPVGEWVIGRGPEADIRIDDDRVSRRHGVVRALPGGWELTDGGSLNGIWIDGRQVQRVDVPAGGLNVRFGGKDGVPVRLLPERAAAPAEAPEVPDGEGEVPAAEEVWGTAPIDVRWHEVTPGWAGWSAEAEGPEDSEERQEQGRLRALMRKVQAKGLQAKRTAGPEDSGPAAGGW